MKNKKLKTSIILLLSVILFIIPHVTAAGSDAGAALYINLVKGHMYSTTTLEEYTTANEPSKTDCETLNPNTGEGGTSPKAGFYFYVTNINQDAGGKYGNLQLIYLDKNKKAKWLEDQPVQINTENTNLDSFNFYEGEGNIYKIANTVITIETCDNAKATTNINTPSFKVLIEEVQPTTVTPSNSDCPQEASLLYTPCREGQVLCMENICGARTLINKFITLKYLDTSYLALYSRSFDSNVAGAALYNDALGYKKIAEIKKSYEIREIGSMPEEITTIASQASKTQISTKTGKTDQVVELGTYCVGATFASYEILVEDGRIATDIIFQYQEGKGWAWKVDKDGSEWKYKGAMDKKEDEEDMNTNFYPLILTDMFKNKCDYGAGIKAIVDNTANYAGTGTLSSALDLIGISPNIIVTHIDLQGNPHKWEYSMGNLKDPNYNAIITITTESIIQK